MTHTIILTGIAALLATAAATTPENPCDKSAVGDSCEPGASSASASDLWTCSYKSATEKDRERKAEKDQSATEKDTSKGEKVCCKALTADCMACAAGLTLEEFCNKNPTTVGCNQGKTTPCCQALTADCMACAAGLRVEEFCFKNPKTVGCNQEETTVCCKALTADCMACSAGVTKEEYCKTNPKALGCKKEETTVCCRSMNAVCLACSAGVTPHEYCEDKPETQGCKTRELMCTPFKLEKSECETCPEAACDVDTDCADGEKCRKFSVVLRGCDTKTKCAKAVCKAAPATAAEDTTTPGNSDTEKPKRPKKCCESEDNLECTACNAGYFDRKEFCVDNVKAKGCTEASDVADATWNRGCKSLCAGSNDANSCGTCAMDAIASDDKTAAAVSDRGKQDRCKSTCTDKGKLQEAKGKYDESDVIAAIAVVSKAGLKGGKGVAKADRTDLEAALAEAAEAFGIEAGFPVKEKATATVAKLESMLSGKNEEAAIIEGQISTCEAVEDAGTTWATDVLKCTADEIAALVDSLAENKALSEDTRNFIAEASTAFLGELEDDAASHLAGAAAAACFAAAAAIVV